MDLFLAWPQFSKHKICIITLLFPQEISKYILHYLYTVTTKRGQPINTQRRKLFNCIQYKTGYTSVFFFSTLYVLPLLSKHKSSFSLTFPVSSCIENKIFQNDITGLNVMCISILNIFISTRHVVTSTILLVCRGQWIHEIRGKIIWLDFFCMILFYEM